MIRVDLLIFDLDGTLVDSVQDLANAAIETFRHFGIPTMTPEEIKPFVSTGTLKLVKHRFLRYAPEKLEDAARFYQDTYYNTMAVHTMIYPGVSEALHHFSAKKKVILTNKSNRFAAPLIERLGLSTHFLSVNGLETFNPPKPHHFPIRELCRIHSVGNSAAIIGDSEIDILAGKNAGIPTIAVSYGYTAMGDLNHYRPDHIVENLAELKRLIA